MTEPRGNAGYDNGRDDRQKPPGDQPPPVPSWVKALGIAIALLLLLGLVMVISGGEHGPGRHLPSGSGGDVAADRSTTASVAGATLW